MPLDKLLAMTKTIFFKTPQIYIFLKQKNNAGLTRHLEVIKLYFLFH